MRKQSRPGYETIRQVTAISPAAGAGETGVHLNGTLHWMRIFLNAPAICIFWHPSGGKAATDRHFPDGLPKSVPIASGMCRSDDEADTFTVESYYIIDEFCKNYDNHTEGYRLPNNTSKKRRNRFVELQQKVPVPKIIFLQMCCPGKCTGISLLNIPGIDALQTL